MRWEQDLFQCFCILSLSCSLTYPFTQPFLGCLEFSSPSSWDIALQRVDSRNLDWIGLLPDGSSTGPGLFQASSSFAFERRTMVQGTVGEVSEGLWTDLQPNVLQCRKQYICIALCRVSHACFLFLTHSGCGPFSQRGSQLVLLMIQTFLDIRWQFNTTLNLE